MTDELERIDSLAPTAAELADADRVIDWALATAAVEKIVRRGPKASIGVAQDAVTELRQAAERSTGYVEEVTGLHANPGEQVFVVDRFAWAKANTDSFRMMLAPALSRALDQRSVQIGLSVGRKVTGAELGSVMAFLSTKVLGQFDIGGSPTAGSGRLLLVAPNVLDAERQLHVDKSDFRLWVCLHEETHRVQFAANPWLREHMIRSTRALSGDLLGDPNAAMERLVRGLRRLPELAGNPDATILDLIQTPEQREQTAALTGVMSLLEGHADVVMDEVGPKVIPSVAEIRERFTQRRRKGASGVDRLLRKLLGMDAKLKQYSDGAVFVRGVIDKVGMDGFNAVWTSPETLPGASEIHDPDAWVARVHG